MKVSQELKNGLFIFIGISAYFLLMEALGYSNNPYLRVLNVFILFYGINKTIKINQERKMNFTQDLFSAGLTAIVGLFLSVVGLIIYILYRGGETYLNSLSKSFLFGGNPSIAEYSIGLFFEGVASAIIVIFILLLLWRDKAQKTD